MSSPTPSLPASIREALDEYGNACAARKLLRSISARTALEAHLLALVADAERWRAFRALGKDSAAMDGIADATRVALTPPEDTTPHE
jgi:hypothetical protein